jgi:alpha-tubulin suppressor-like RCC1 family protein
VPVAVSGLVSAAVRTGWAFACALVGDGTVRCWGANGNGQLGDGTTDDRSTPPSSDAGANVAAVSAGELHTCALTTAGGVRCWGHNLYAELGTGDHVGLLSPPATDVLTGVKQVIASNLFTCALTMSGGVRCWGYNNDGAMGDDTPLAVDRPVPTPTDLLGAVASIAAGADHVCARMTSGGVRCWGGNANGQLGDGMRPTLALYPPPRDIPGFTGTCQ